MAMDYSNAQPSLQPRSRHPTATQWNYISHERDGYTPTNDFMPKRRDTEYIVNRKLYQDHGVHGRRGRMPLKLLKVMQFRNLLDQLDNEPMSAQQEHALGCLRGILRTSRRETRPGIEVLRVLAECLDILLFAGLLRTRYHISYVDPSTPHQCWGETRIDRGSIENQRIETFLISINTAERPDGRQFFGIFETLIHELCHAFLLLLLDPKALSCGEMIEVCGLEGHGSLFVELYTQCAKVLTKRGCHQINVSEKLEVSLWNSQQKRSAMVCLWQTSIRDMPEQEKTYTSILKALSLPASEQLRLRDFIYQGRSLLEIICVFMFKLLESEWRHPFQGRSGAVDSINVPLGMEDSPFLCSQYSHFVQTQSGGFSKFEIFMSAILGRIHSVRSFMDNA